jgi:DNA mismatch repair ATPase MutS
MLSEADWPLFRAEVSRLEKLLTSASDTVRHQLARAWASAKQWPSVVDAILEGKSRFYAELERVRETLRSARVSPVLFLIDEILSGTNSRDRRIASESIVRALMEHGAIGVLSTHDLALTEIADLPGLRGSNVHMSSRSGENVMDFDYILKPGATAETNALAIAAMMGVLLPERPC